MTPLYNALKQHKQLNRSSFHTPGHKNHKHIISKNLLDLDYTELPDTDSLYESKEAIKESENLTASLYRTKYTLFSAGGCSLCIQTMIKLALPYGGKIIASRMIHKSAVNTMALLNAQVIWTMPKIDPSSGLIGQVCPKDIENLLIKNPDAACVYITSPDYYGHIADISSIAKVCKKNGVPLLVDNAHGSHLKFLTRDIHPITLGADMSADSAHKTLPVLTGGAFLHIANEKYIDKAKNTMSLFGSTSPSYPIMASLDICQDWLKKYGKDSYKKLENDILKIKEFAKLKGILDTYSLSDPIRISLNTSSIGISGINAAEYFRQYHIEPELSDNERVVFISTPMNSKKDLECLNTAIKDLPIMEPIKISSPIFSVPLLAKSLHESLFGDSEQISTINAIGRISANTICPCPPGIPILVPGEIINDNSIKNLLHYGIFLIDVLK